jgi:hypothetical protein
MELTVSLICLLVAAILFLLAGFNLDEARGRFNLIGLGLFFLTLSFILPG